MSSHPRSWLDSLVGGCFSLLLAAVAVYVAVRLIERIWVALLVILGLAGILALAIAFLRGRRRSW